MILKASTLEVLDYVLFLVFQHFAVRLPDRVSELLQAAIGSPVVDEAPVGLQPVLDRATVHEDDLPAEVAEENLILGSGVLGVILEADAFEPLDKVGVAITESLAFHLREREPIDWQSSVLAVILGEHVLDGRGGKSDAVVLARGRSREGRHGQREALHDQK